MPRAGAFVYIMASGSGVLYTGTTNNLIRRDYEHKNQTEGDSFTSKYNCRKLVYFEGYGTMLEAIAREKQLKGWRRNKKMALIASMNLEWNDLSTML